MCLALPHHDIVSFHNNIGVDGAKCLSEGLNKHCVCTRTSDIKVTGHNEVDMH